jgi:subtilisin-like proprotein convertase family protein
VLAAAALAAAPAPALVHQFDNTTAGGLPGCGAPLVRTFTVSASFTVAQVAVGLNASHTSRDDIFVSLTSPGATVVTLIPGSGAGDGNDNYDILMSTNTEGALNDGDNDTTAAPVYNRLVTVAGMSAFAGSASAGTWTLAICDNSGGASGTFNSARLVLSDATTATTVCSSRILLDWTTLGNGTDFTNTTVGGITVTETSATDIGGTGAVGASAPTFRIDTQQQGGITGFYRFWMDAANTGGAQAFEDIGQVAAFGFSQPVLDLGFTMVDNDFAAGDFEDYHRIEGSRSSAFTPYERSIGSASQAAGDIVEGDTASAATSTAGSSSYLFSGLVDTLGVVYMAGDLQDDPGDQIIGLHDLQFCAFDYGDAPSTYGTALGTGARHVLGSRAVWLGANRPDGESDGQAAGAGADATPDDAATVGGVDDEDAVGTFPVCPQDGTYTVTVAASNATSPASNAFLAGYIDWNRDGDFADAGERSATVTVPQASADPSNFAVTWSSVPANCGGTTQTYARFRVGTVQSEVESPTGLAVDGEVEDYRIPVNTLPVTISWVDSARRSTGTVVRWRTSTETGNVGFRVWGHSKAGRRLLARVPSKVFDSFAPTDYEVVLDATDLTAVEIVDLAVDGRTRRHGPFAVGRAHGERGGEMPVDWAAIRAEAELAATGSARRAVATGARLLVERAGIQRVSYEDLAAAGVDLAGVAATDIALADAGRPLARFVSADPFGPGAWIEFVLAAPATTLASPHDVVILTTGGAPGLGPGSFANAAPAGPARVAASVEARPDRAYGFASPTGDPWYDEALLAWGAPQRLEREFDLPDWAGGAVDLTVGGWGYTDWPGDSPDHHVTVALNGVEVLSDRFDGRAPWSRTIEVSAVALASGNRLEVTVTGDTGYAFDLVAIDGFDVAYVRASRALDGAFRGAAGPGYAVTGFGGDEVVAWIGHGGEGAEVAKRAAGGAGLAAPAGPRRGTAPAGSGAISIPAGAGEVFAATPGAMARPRVVAGVPAAVAGSDAEYLIVTHPAFRPAIGELEAFEASRGFDVGTVEVESIYAAYSDHAPSPDAIRAFLTESIGGGGTRYVLLVGTDTTDAWDRLGTGAVSFVPTAYLPANPFVRFAPSDEHLADADGDRIADVPIGRLPVRTAAELATVVSKLVQWESRAGERSTLLVAGGSDGNVALSRVNGSYARTLGAWPWQRVEVDGVGTAAARAQLLAGIDGGVALVSFVGHSSPDRWDFQPLLSVADVAGLGNVGRPSLFLQWGCWNSYAYDPAYESLSSRLLLEPGVGAAGTVGATTLTADRVHDRLAVHFYRVMRDGVATTLGDALREAKLRLRAEGAASDDVLLGVAILGDPASTLPGAD